MRLFTFSTTLALSFLAACTVSAQPAVQQVNNDEKQEFAFTVGELSGSNPNVAGIPATLGSGAGIEASFARKIKDLKFGNLYWEVDALGGPLRYLSVPPLSHAVRSVFVAPGFKLQFLPAERWSPWIAGGAGYAFYDASATVTNALTGTSSTSFKTDTYAVDFGGGVDYAISKHYIIRGDVRGYYTGGPKFGLGSTSGQLNVVIGGGIVWRFSK